VLTVLRTSGLATVQDLGWPTGRSVGLPQSGAIDPPALQTANALVGNPIGAAAIEVALGGLTVRFGDTRRFAITGAAAAQAGADNGRNPRTTHLARAGDVLTVEPRESGRFGYLAVEGGIDVPLTLGSRATYLPIAMGGYRGRRLLANDELPLGAALGGPPAGFQAPGETVAIGAIRLVAGPQVQLFSEETLSRLEASTYTISPASDRMGTRLVGPSIAPAVKASLPSEAACLGALQVPDDGQPIALLADGPTVGGYPKVGVIASADLPRFGQLPIGAAVRFRLISIAESQDLRSAAIERLQATLSAIRKEWRG